MASLRNPLVLVIVLASLALAYPGDCGKSFENYLEPGEKHSYLELGGGHALFSAEGRYVMLAECLEEARFLTNEAEIEGILSEYASTNTGGSVKPDQEWQVRMNAFLSAFSSSRLKEEECKRYTGTDKSPCNDMLSCFKACSTPLCDVKYGSGCELRGSGIKECDFIGGVLSFSQDTTYIDAATERVERVVSEALEREDVASLDEGIGSVDGILGACGRINENVLTRTLAEKGYYFCPKVPYDTDSLGYLKDELVELRNRYSLIIRPGETAKLVASETARRMELRANLDYCAEEINRTGMAAVELKSSPSPVADYAEVASSVGLLLAQGEEVKRLCGNREFAGAREAVEKFDRYDMDARGVLSNLSSEYYSTKALYEKVYSQAAFLPQSENATSILESLRLVERELPLVRSGSDLGILKEVLLDDEMQVISLSKPAPGFAEQLGLPLVVAVGLTLLLFFVMKRTRRQGL